jgi:hypothetical protein
LLEPAGVGLDFPHCIETILFFFEKDQLLAPVPTLGVGVFSSCSHLHFGISAQWWFGLVGSASSATATTTSWSLAFVLVECDSSAMNVEMSVLLKRRTAVF